MRYSVMGVPMLDQPFGYLLSFLTDWAQTCQLAILLLMRSIEVGSLYPTCGVSNVIFAQVRPLSNAAWGWICTVARFLPSCINAALKVRYDQLGPECTGFDHGLVNAQLRQTRHGFGTDFSGTGL